MTNEDIIDNPHYFPFEVIAVHNNVSQIEQNTEISLPQPVNVKIKIRNKDEMVKGERRFISMPKFNSNSWPKKVRLVTSDQTIMSFKLVMVPNKEENGKKPHKGLLKMFKPGGCLSIHNDEEKYSYIPSTSNELNRNSEPGIENFKSNTINEKFSLKKNVFSPSYTNTYKTPKQFMGKCKPGGCLDPPFDEDKYVYKPTIEGNKISEQSLKKSDNKALLDTNKDPTKVKLNNQRSDALLQSQTDLKTDPEDTDSLVTYHLSVSSSNTENRDSQSRKSKSGMNSEQLELSRQLTNEFPISFFMPPRKEKPKQIKEQDDYHEKENKVKETYVNNEYIVQNQTPSEILSETFTITSPSVKDPLTEVIQEKETNKKSELPLRKNAVTRKSEDFFISDIDDMTGDEKIFSNKKITESPSRVPSVMEKKNIVSKTTDTNRVFYNNTDILKQSVEKDVIKKNKVESFVSEDKITGPGTQSRSSLSVLKLSRENLTTDTINELSSLLRDSDKANVAEVDFSKVVERDALKYEALKDTSTINLITNAISNKVNESNLKSRQKELKRKSIDEWNGLINHSENKNIDDIYVKEKPLIRTNNILDSMTKEIFEKESLKFESPNDSSTTSLTDISIKVSKSDLKSIQEELTKKSIDESTGLLNHPGHEYLADRVVKGESRSQSKINNSLEPIQKEVFAKQILKYDASKDSLATISVTNNIATRNYESKLKSSPVELTKNSIDELNDHSENINITEMDVKEVTRSRIGPDSVLDPIQNKIFKKDTLKNEILTNDISIKSNYKNESDTLQNETLDGNKTIEKSYNKQVENLNVPIILSTEKILVPSKTIENENNIKQIERLFDQKSNIVSEYSIKRGSTDLNLKKPNIKSSKSTISENSLNINVMDDLNTPLINTFSTTTELQPNKIISKMTSELYEENQVVNKDKGNTLNNHESNQDILEVLKSDSIESIMIANKSISSKKISKSEVAHNEIFQNKNTFNQSPYKLNDSNSGSLLPVSKPQYLDNESLDIKKHISADDGLHDEVDNWTTNEKISIKSMKKISDSNINFIIQEDNTKKITRLSSLSKKIDDKYLKNDIKKSNLNALKTDIEVITKTDREPYEKGNHELNSPKSANMIQDLNKTPLSSSLIDHNKYIESSVAINFSFNLSTNEFGYTIETLDPSTDLAPYVQDKTATIRTTLRNDDSGLKIKIDSETDMTIQLKRRSKQFKGSKSQASNGRGNIIRAYSSETSLLKNTLKTVYETLVPIEKVLANLKEEANTLFRDQLLIKKILSSMEVKPKRLVHTNKTCSCLKKEIGIN